jgi:hypothetical protein
VRRLLWRCAATGEVNSSNADCDGRHEDALAGRMPPATNMLHQVTGRGVSTVRGTSDGSCTTHETSVCGAPGCLHVPMLVCLKCLLDDLLVQGEVQGEV